MKKTKRFNWPISIKPDEDEAEDVSKFYPGAFIRMLLNKVWLKNSLTGTGLIVFYLQLSRVLDQSYDINLQVTSVVSRFCLVPHVHLTEFALDPLLDTREGARTLYTTLLVSL